MVNVEPLCKGLLVHLLIFHVYMMLAGVTTYEYIRQQRLVERVEGGG